MFYKGNAYKPMKMCKFIPHTIKNSDIGNRK